MSDVKQRLLGGLHIAFLVTDASTHDGLAHARETLEGQGTIVKVVGARRSGTGASAQNPQAADLTFDQARPDDFDGVLVDGNTAALDQLNALPDAARLLRGMQKEGKPIGLLDDDAEAGTRDFMTALARRTRDSVRGTADSLPGAASMGG